MTGKDNNEWFSFDKEGFASTIEELARLVLELWQNAVDEAVTMVNIVLRPIEGRRGVAYLRVEDDSPEGFADLSESYKVYAKSKKRDDPTKRGRMNIGEKRVLALCESATITSTTGTVVFQADGKRTTTRVKRDAGTVFEAVIRLKKPQVEEALNLLGMVLVPPGVTLTVNDEEITHREPSLVLTGTLATVLPDEDGKLSRDTRRRTEIHLVDVRGLETAHIFEMGIPVCETDFPWHVDVQQRVPLNTERDNVPPRYLRELREYVLNASYDQLDTEEAHKPWVAEALPQASEEALKKVIDERFGEKRAIYDPSCPEANLRAHEAGYTLIRGRQLPAGTFTRLKETGLAKPAGQHLEFRRDVQASPDGKDFTIPEDKWTPGMHRMARYANDLALELLGFSIEVDISRYPFGVTKCGAHFGGRNLTFNLTSLSHRFFDEPEPHEVDELLIHEFAHNKVENHLTDAYYKECCRLGALLRDCKTRL